ncbi:GerAB/ArcD/ProY family transporter [Halalkalibacter krulwichiae]|uniref:Spore germination protein YndE n=1 Tax=Halalkalibacter krulwichiae TaxID=199441 RepID=A0A1X9MGR4_9BACI|nr:GerAB/ArcD/ProY family transporter [Halalkalibacter krulwichiae]ARK32628.1 Spore germination protein YndE [Halalkalibacter krulwichiae]
MISLEQKIGMREATALISLTIGLKISDLTPSVLFPYSMTATWMVPIISSFIIVIPLLLLAAVQQKYPQKGLLDLIYFLTGKYVGFVLCFVLLLFFLATTIIYSRNFVDIVGSLYFPQTPPTFLYAVIMLAVFLIVTRGLEGVSRSAWLVLPYLLISFAILLLFVWGDLTWANLLPFTGSGMRQLLIEGTKHSFLFAELFLLFILAPFIRSYQAVRKATIVGFCVSLFALVIFFAVYIAMYNYPSVEHTAYPFQLLTRSVDLGPIFGNTESLFLGFWAIAMIVRLAIYLFVTFAIYSFVIRPKKQNFHLFVFTALIVAIGLVPESNIDILLFLRENWLYQLNWYLLLGIPLLIWVVGRSKKEERV